MKAQSLTRWLLVLLATLLSTVAYAAPGRVVQAAGTAMQSTPAASTALTPALDVGQPTVGVTSADGLPASQTWKISATLVPNSGPPGTPVTMTGSGFWSGETIAITINHSTVASTAAGNLGQFSVAFTLPAALPAGTVIVQATGQASLRSASAIYTVLPASLALSPTSGPIGTQVAAGGQNFAPHELVTLTLAGLQVATPTADGSGAWTVSFTVPVGIAPGALIVTATGAASHAGASATFTLVAPIPGVLTFAINPINAGQTETATGCGFGSISSALLTIATTPGGTIVYGPLTITNVVPTGVPGCYNITFVVPSLPPGTYQVSATHGVTDSGLLQINPGIGVGGLQFVTNPITAGQSETATGCGFGSISSVSLTIATAPGGTLIYGPVTITTVYPAGSPGCYSITFAVPSLSSGAYTVTVTNGGITDSGLLQVTFGTGPGVLSLSPRTASGGARITAGGCGFRLADTITAWISSAGLGSRTQLGISAPVFAGTGFDGTACFTFTFYVPYVGNGLFSIQALGSASGTMDTGTLTVVS